MAVHAGLRRRHVRETRRLDGRVAIQAIHAQPPDMVSVTERDWLFAHLCRPSLVAGTIQLRKGPRQKTQNKNCAKNRDSRECIGAVMKDLGHSLTFVPTVSTSVQCASGRQRYPAKFPH